MTTCEDTRWLVLTADPTPQQIIPEEPNNDASQGTRWLRLTPEVIHQKKGIEPPETNQTQDK